MLPGNHTQVSSLGVHDFYANEDKFTKIMGLRSVQTSVFLAGDTIFYTVMIDGLSYRHGQTVLVDPRYVIHSQRIEGGFVIREMKRNPVFIGTFCILFPLLLSFVLPLFIILIQENRKCGERRTNYKYVFCAWLDKLI